MVDSTKKFWTSEDLAQLIVSTHDPKAKEAHAVHILFEDGEHVYTKGGDVFGLRTMHSFHEGGYIAEYFQRMLHKVMPAELNGYKCIMHTDMKVIEELVKMLEAHAAYELTEPSRELYETILHSMMHTSKQIMSKEDLYTRMSKRCDEIAVELGMDHHTRMAGRSDRLGITLTHEARKELCTLPEGWHSRIEMHPNGLLLYITFYKKGLQSAMLQLWNREAQEGEKSLGWPQVDLWTLNDCDGVEVPEADDQYDFTQDRTGQELAEMIRQLKRYMK
jgi:hypothetical protein